MNNPNSPEELVTLHSGTREGATLCLQPEALLDWVEQGSRYWDKSRSQKHILTCADCRRAYVQMLEIRALQRKAIERAGLLSARIAVWRDHLRENRVIVPLPRVRAALQRLTTGLAANEMTLAVRGGESSDILEYSPAFTAIRTTQPQLRWAAVPFALSYSVEVKRRRGNSRPRLVGTYEAGAEHSYTLPQEAGIEAGGVYEWQVTARKEYPHQDDFSPCLRFFVLREALQQEVAALEQEADDSALARIGIYLVYGLYEEAMREGDRLLASNEDKAAQQINIQLQQHRARLFSESAE